MPELTVSYPDELGDTVHMTTDELAAHLRLMAAVKMFELGKLSSGQAARLAGLPRVTFLEACSTYRVSPFNYPDADTRSELSADIASASQALS